MCVCLCLVRRAKTTNGWNNGKVFTYGGEHGVGRRRKGERYMREIDKRGGMDKNEKDCHV